MKITVKLFALLAKYLPDGTKGNEAEIEVLEGVSVQDVIHALNLPSEHCHLVLVNGVYIAPSERPDRILVPKDALAIWPPVAGG